MTYFGLMKKILILNLALGSFFFALSARAADATYLCTISKVGNAILDENSDYTLRLDEQKDHIFVTLEWDRKQLTAHQFKGSKTAFISTQEDEKNEFYHQANPVYIHLSHSLAEHKAQGEVTLTPRWSGDSSRVDILSCQK